MNKLITLCLFLAVPAFAARMGFVYDGWLPGGDISGQVFGQTHVVLTAMADPEIRQSTSAGYYVNHQAWINMGLVTRGLTIEIYTATHTFVNHRTQIVGLTNAESGGDLIYSSAQPFLATWDMASSIGAFSGTGSIQPGWPILTSQGLLTVTSGFVNQLRFEAIYDEDDGSSAIPEPTPVSLLITSAIVLYWLKRWHNKTDQ